MHRPTLEGIGRGNKLQVFAVLPSLFQTTTPTTTTTAMGDFFFVITIHLCMPAIEHTTGPLHLTPMTSVCSLLLQDKECGVLHFYVYAFRGL